MPSIRIATDADLDLLEEIENDADRRFLERFHPADWTPAERGRARAARPGFLLVAAPSDDARAVGFAHVLEQDGRAHLE